MTGSARRRTYDTSTDPSRGGFRREVAAALGLFVLLFNLIAGTALAATARDGTAPFLDEIFGDRVVICSGAGMIVLDAEGNPVRSDGGVDAMCVYCLPMVAGSADAPVVVALLDAPVVAAPEVSAPLLVAATTGEPLVAATSPRGPPRL